MLISANELTNALDGSDAPVVLDVRWSLTGGADRAAYDAGHIPGAVFLDFDRDVCGPPGDQGRHPLPDPGRLQAALRLAGIDDGDEVVVVDGGDPSEASARLGRDVYLLAAARTWWTLRWAGLDDIQVLDGGYARWTGPIDTAAPSPVPGTVTVRPGSMPVLDADDAAELAGRGSLIDVRTPERFHGEHEPIDTVAGHIPGARNVPDPVVVDGHLVVPDAIRQLPAPRAAYCGSGVTAARLVLAAATAGVDVALYVGSWSDWITDPRRPVATGSDR